MSDLCKCGHAKDHHFTPRLGGRCFRHECECVAFEAPVADHDDLAAILANHRLFGTENDDFAEHKCGCGLSPDANDELRYEDFGELIWHEAHVADVAGDWLAGVKAQAAQDERDRMLKPWPGEWVIHDGCDDTPEVRHYHVGDRCPYRADRVNAEDTDNTTDRT